MVAPPLKVKSTLQFPEPVNGILLGEKKKRKVFINVGFPGSSVVKNPPANEGGMALIPESGRSPREGNGTPLQYSCLEIPWTEDPGGLQSMGSQRVGHE